MFPVRMNLANELISETRRNRPPNEIKFLFHAGRGGVNENLFYQIRRSSRKKVQHAFNRFRFSQFFSLRLHIKNGLSKAALKSRMEKPQINESRTLKWMSATSLSKTFRFESLLDLANVQ